MNEDGNVNPVMSLKLGIEHTILLLPSSVSEFLKHWLELEWRLATPQNPQYAFCFEFLDWCEALLLECQVSLKDLCINVHTL